MNRLPPKEKAKATQKPYKELIRCVAQLFWYVIPGKMKENFTLLQKEEIAELLKKHSKKCKKKKNILSAILDYDSSHFFKHLNEAKALFELFIGIFPQNYFFSQKIKIQTFLKRNYDLNYKLKNMYIQISPL